MPEQIKTSGENELLTLKQAAERLKVSRRALTYWIKQGLISAYKINPESKHSRYRIRAAELEKLLVRVKVQDYNGEEQDTEHIPKQSTETAGNVEILG